jgi:hypothetical protein
VTQSRPAPLRSNEEVTLRRVAYGQSKVTSLRVQDLLHLRALKLIEGTPLAPTLTADGKRRFDALPKAAVLTEFKAQNELLATLTKLISRRARPR